MPEQCVESFAGVGNPFSMGQIGPGETVVDVGSGAGFDSLVAAQMVGEHGSVTGVDMTPQMLQKARRNALRMGATNVKFRKGLAEALPLLDGMADVVINNGIFNLVPDKKAGSEGDLQGAQAIGPSLSFGHRDTQAGLRKRLAERRPLDRLNRRCSPGGRVSGPTAQGWVR